MLTKNRFIQKYESRSVKLQTWPWEQSGSGDHHVQVSLKSESSDMWSRRRQTHHHCTSSLVHWQDEQLCGRRSSAVWAMASHIYVNMYVEKDAQVESGYIAHTGNSRTVLMLLFEQITGSQGRRFAEHFNETRGKHSLVPNRIMNKPLEQTKLIKRPGWLQ